MTLQMLSSIYLHSNNVLHYDLSMQAATVNILLKGGNKAKLSDFGMSTIVEANPHMTVSKLTQVPGVPVFMPPEALRAKPCYSDKLNVFSLGVVMIQIITHEFPTPTDAEIIYHER